MAPLSDEAKKNTARLGMVSVPIYFLIMLNQSVNKMADSVGELNRNMAVVTSQIQRNKEDIEYQRNRLEKLLESIREQLKRN